MKLTILVDNNTQIDKYLLAEPALCFYIEEDDKKILFDCGYSDVFMQNSHKLRVDICDIDYICLSHSHNDHTGGLMYLKQFYQSSIDLGFDVKTPNILALESIFEPIYDEKQEMCPHLYQRNI